MLSLGPIAFVTPWLLAALALLPVLWLLLRILPPLPRSIRFPAIRLLYQLQSREESPDTAPWWLLLLRLLFAAILIVALAHPILDPEPALPGNGPLLLVVDDGWSAGPGWRRVNEAADALLVAAEREQRPVAVAGTTIVPDGAPILSRLGLASDARGLLRTMAPKPWRPAPQALIDALAVASLQPPLHAVWFADPVADPGDRELATALQRLGSLTVVRDPGAAVQILLPPENSGREFATTVRRSVAGPAMAVGVQASAADGRVLARAEGAFADGDRDAKLTVSLPIELRNEVARVEVLGEASAAAVAVLDDSFKRRPVGLVAETGFQAPQPLLEELYYLEQALKPFSEVTRGPIDQFLDGDTSVIVLGDAGLLTFAEREKVRAWLGRGGVLVRFAGPLLAAASAESRGLDEQQLLPVRLRSGERALGGALSWSAPVGIAPYPQDSPFADITGYPEVRIRRQVLAEPSLDLGPRTWARLVDGTPIVTAEHRDSGWIVLFHTTANPEWSDLPLSGLFVEMMRRIAALGSGKEERRSDQPLPPIEVLDGLGRAVSPPSWARALEPDAEGRLPSEVAPGRAPGFYGTHTSRVALNLGPTVAEAEPLGSLPAGVVERPLTKAPERDLMPPLLVLALLLLLADILATLALRGLLPGLGRLGRGAGVAAVLLALALAAALPTGPAAAQDTRDDFAMKASLDTRLAYVRTGYPEVDEAVRSGLSSLSDVLVRRTAIEPAEPVGVDVEKDELAFFALIYWAVTPGQVDLSDAAVGHLNAYMRNGGTILFDTRDQLTSGYGATVGQGMLRLREISKRLDIPPLAPVPPDHVLTKAFYLLREFPGRFTGGQVWIQDAKVEGRSEVTPVIIGTHDWVGAWARAADGHFAFPVVPGGELQREMAFRFGVNLMMYALTGNYKADQVHVPAILERLGE